MPRKRNSYPCDLTDEEWARIAPLMPKPGRLERSREVDFREVINAVRYLVRSGCGWRMLPVHFGPWQTVYNWFRELVRRFLFQTIHDVERMLDRERQGREQSPSAEVIDSQSIKAPHAKTGGCDAGKKIVGRERHIAVDIDGRLLMVNLTTADISDSEGAQAILDGIRKRGPWVKHLFADGAYDRLKLMEKASYLDLVVEIIRRSDDQQGFIPIESEQTVKPSTVDSDAAESKGGWPRSEPSASGSSPSKAAQQESALEIHHDHTIEKAFLPLKGMLRKVGERTVSGLWDLIGQLVDLFKPAECANYFTSCGYNPD